MREVHEEFLHPLPNDIHSRIHDYRDKLRSIACVRYHPDVMVRITEVEQSIKTIEGRRKDGIDVGRLEVARAALRHLNRELVRTHISFGTTLYAVVRCCDGWKRYVNLYQIVDGKPVKIDWLVRRLLPVKIKDTPQTYAGIVLDIDTQIRDLTERLGRDSWGDGYAFPVEEI